MNLTDIFDGVRKEHYNACGDKSQFTEDGVGFIRSVLACDRLVNSCAGYDGILITSKEQTSPVVGERFYGDVFLDRKKRFKDGVFIITSTVQEIIPLHTEIALIKTNRSNYLVIQ